MGFNGILWWFNGFLMGYILWWTNIAIENYDTHFEEELPYILVGKYTVNGG